MGYVNQMLLSMTIKYFFQYFINFTVFNFVHITIFFFWELRKIVKKVYRFDF